MEYVTLDDIFIDYVDYQLTLFWFIVNKKGTYLSFGEYCRIFQKHGNIIIY